MADRFPPRPGDLTAEEIEGAVYDAYQQEAKPAWTPCPRCKGLVDLSRPGPHHCEAELRIAQLEQLLRIILALVGGREIPGDLWRVVSEQARSVLRREGGT